MQMTNNTYMEQMVDVISHPLEEPYHKKFLIRLEELKEISTKIKFIFSGKEAILLGDYILHYQELLFKMYQYQILLGKLKDASQEFRLTIEKARETVGENQYTRRINKKRLTI